MSPFAFARQLTLSVLAFLFCFTLASAAPVKFDIPAQPAADALVLFSKQSGLDVLFSSKELKKVTSQAVVGEFEPDAAIAQLLKDTGFTATRDGGKFVVKADVKTVAVGSIRGSLGKGLAPGNDILVMIRETGQQTRTDKNGDFNFASVEPGTHLLVATADGYQTLHITDVVVKPGFEVSLSREELHAANGTLTLEPFVVKAESVLNLEKVEVTDSRPKPFSGANVDIPRAINDVQAYYVFDSKTIDQSGATNVEDFLKQRLTMNTQLGSNGDRLAAGATAIGGNTSSVNLRGLGTDKTLILINGRRSAEVFVGSTTFQPNLNGIPLSAIDRIEVLPSSASGIYGGSAIGGVVNVILKHDFKGGEIRASYDNAFDTDAANRSLAITYGMGLEDGKTNVLMSATWSGSRPMLLKDRLNLVLDGRNKILANFPGFYAGNSTPPIGSLPNILSDFSGDLSLRDGTPLNSTITTIPAGTSPTTPASVLFAGLLANAGKFDLTIPNTTQVGGLLQPYGRDTTNYGYQLSLRRQMAPNLQLFAEFTANYSKQIGLFNPFTLLEVFSTPSNPIQQDYFIRLPDNTAGPYRNDTSSLMFSIGAVVNLPWHWSGEFDYTRSSNRFNFLYPGTDASALSTDVNSGALNIFVDSLQYPINFSKYLVPTFQVNKSYLDDWAARGSGPLPALPWGVPTLTVGLERRIQLSPDRTETTIFPISTGRNNIVTYFKRRSVADSLYGETLVPLVQPNWLPFVHALDLQLSGRSERFDVDTGTPQSTTLLATGVTTYSSPNINSTTPIFSKASYQSTNATVGLKYQPIPEITIRASRASAFLPPAPAQLIKDPLPSPFPTTIVDPVKGISYGVQTLAGGNPDLTPQNSKSTNAGIIWQPTWKPLEGLRLDAEYYWIEQFNAIGSLSAQQFVTLEGAYPGRVTRDPTSGLVTLVDTSNVNVFKRSTEGFDLSLDYRLKTGVGVFALHAAESIILHLKQQLSLTLPNQEYLYYVHAPIQGTDAGAIKYKGNANLTWEMRNWMLGWATRYYGEYKQFGSPGDPSTTSTRVYRAQGSAWIPSQTYHDVFVGYDFHERRTKVANWRDRVTDGLSLQCTVRNVFNTLPPFDAFYASQGAFVSPYADARLRTYQVSIKKTF